VKEYFLVMKDGSNDESDFITHHPVKPEVYAAA
jgi:hypothetical protein